MIRPLHHALSRCQASRPVWRGSRGRNDLTAASVPSEMRAALSVAGRSFASLAGGPGIDVFGRGKLSCQGLVKCTPSVLGAGESLGHGIDRRSSSAAAVLDEDDAPFGLFEDLKGLHPDSKTAVTKKLGHTSMTEIQSKTFEAASSGRDVLGRARTGTGKTMAFLLPALENALRKGDEPGSNVGVLVISPTRELAIQIADQARALTSCHRGLSSQVMYGGVNKMADVRKLERGLPTVLVATPGRLLDHLESTRVRGVPFSDIIRRTRVLVLDETDRLLDMGFRREVDRIIEATPSNRQTLLFSATIPPGVRSVMAETMKPDYLTVDCIHDHDPATHTNAQVDQSHVIVPSSASVTGPVEILTRMMDADPNHKLIVFFPTANLTSFYADLFNFGLKRPVIEIHSRKTQSYRTSASNRFREKSGGVTMFTSDVSARGVDYPDVTDVVQVGMPDGRETYIHRLGRTGRAGKRGRGLIVLTEAERGFLGERLQGLDVPAHEEYTELVSVEAGSEGVPVSERLERVRDVLRSGKARNFVSAAHKAYRSILGYYRPLLPQIGVTSKREIVKLANGFAESAGLESPPEIDQKLAKNIGLLMVPELKVRGEDRGGRSFGGSGGNRPSRFRDQGKDGYRDRSEDYNTWGSRANGYWNKRPSRGRQSDGGENGGGRRRQQRQEFSNQDSKWNDWVEDRRRGW